MKNDMEKGILQSFLKNKWKPQDIYDLFPNSVSFQNEINQNKTGYCWLIAALYKIIHYTQNKYLEKDIIFSVEHLIYYDKLEKANYFLEHILNTLQLSETDRKITYLLNHAMTDKGQWQMAANLICKYGLVPVKDKSEQCVIRKTGELNASLSFLLRYQAAVLRKKYRDGIGYQELQTYKEEILEKVRKILTDYYGEQPTFIQIPKYCVNELGENKGISPLEFYNKFIRFPFQDYICIIHIGEEEKFYIQNEVELDGNIIGGKKNSFLHLPEHEFYYAIYEQVKNQELCWIGCDAGKFLFSEYGIFDDSTFELSSIMGNDFEHKINKTTIFKYKIASASHAMLLCEVAENDGQVWWKAQNSIQNPSLDNGSYYLSDSWLRKYLFYAVVNRRYLPDNIDIKIRGIKPWKLFILA